MSVLFVICAVLAIAAGAATVGAKIERDRSAKLREAGRIEDALKLEAKANELDVAHEALEVVVGVGHRVAGGEPFVQAVLEEEQSPEAQRLIGTLMPGPFKVGMILFALSLALGTGCTAAQKAELKEAEVVAAADADTLCSIVIGGAVQLKSLQAADPALYQAVADKVSTAAAQLATKAGVSSAHAAGLQADLSNPANLDGVIAHATAVKSEIAAVDTPLGSGR